MNPNRNLQCTVALLLLTFGAKAQNEVILWSPGKPQITAADASITSRWVPMTYNPQKAPVLKIPKRKNDSPFFCDELMKYKNGYIINDITTAPAAGITEVRYSFYYFDTQTNKLYKLNIPGLDTTESIITYNNGNAACASGKAHGLPKIIAFDNGTTSGIETAITGSTQLLGSDSWIKMFRSGQDLYALDKNGLYNYNTNSWKSIAAFSIDNFYTQNLHFRHSKTVIPTENIQIAGNKLYFLQEVVQQRDSYLLEYDLTKRTGLANFWDKYGIQDNYDKQINSYTILADGSVLIGASRLFGNNLLMKEKDDSLSVFIFNNMINNGQGTEGDIQSRKAIVVDSAIYIAGDNGIFKMQNAEITPVVFFTNGTQEIKDKDGNIHFDFNPRCFEKVADNTFLIGGLFGGLYQVNINTNKIICLDDVDEEKITAIALGDIK